MTPRLANVVRAGVAAIGLLLALPLAPAMDVREPAGITIDYPAAGSVFPPEFPAPEFLWRDPATAASSWSIEVVFSDGAPPIRTSARGEPMRLGPIDPRCATPANAPPALNPDIRTWRPDAATWNAIKRHSTAGPATILIAGHNDLAKPDLVSRGKVTIQTSTDSVGAPIFYRDVPLMPSEVSKGVIKPLAPSAVPLIAWRLRDVGDSTSTLLMQGLHSCANCHSFSSDGKTMGMDVDGPGNDKGLYALTSVAPRTSIRKEDIVEWSSFRGKLGSPIRVGFMSRVSPDGRYVVTTINDPGEPQSEYQRRKNPTDLIRNYYVANFKDFRFLQVFYPTRGMLAWYSREAGKLTPLPGADDPRYVHTGATWSPDGKFLVFSRADARDAYSPGGKLAEYANDPNETQIRYDLYRVPFNQGKGGTPEPIAGASHNGMSNSFPKVSPDGRWIVYVQARNGQLMRPDSQLYIVPAAGGEARRMRCNTPTMNSWHSFSPNGRWLVFSSKARSPYTQMYLTHLDENGNDTPAILIENTTAANRAVNIPEFVNIPRGGLVSMDAPATDYYRIVDAASALMTRKMFDEAATEWKNALELQPGEASAHYNLGLCLFQSGRTAEAIEQYARALEISPEYPDAHNNLGAALTSVGRLDEAILHFQEAVRLDPARASAQMNLGTLLSREGRFAEAIPPLENALQLPAGKKAATLDLLAGAYAGLGRFADAATAVREALALAEKENDTQLVETLKTRLAYYESKR